MSKSYALGDLSKPAQETLKDYLFEKYDNLESYAVVDFYRYQWTSEDGERSIDELKAKVFINFGTHQIVAEYRLDNKNEYARWYCALWSGATLITKE